MEEIHLKVVPQSAHDAFNFLMSTIQQMPFYNKYGYKVSLPQDDEILELSINPSRLKDLDQNTLGNRFIKEIYNPDDFILGLEAINQELPKIRSHSSQFNLLHQWWGFKIFPKYLIKLTLYGPGGNYNAKTGVILIKTTKQGTFVEPPLELILHELVHLGIEDLLVKKYHLSHNTKEALVDQICFLSFSGLFKEAPNNPFSGILTPETIKHLPEVLDRQTPTISSLPKQV